MGAENSMPGLETPTAADKPKGLVPRSAIWLLSGVLIVGLVAYAIYDVNRETARRAADAKKAPDASLGSAPSQDALKRIMAAQAAASAAQAAASAAQVRTALAVGRPDAVVPAAIVERADAGKPAGAIDMPVAPAAHERDAKAMAAHAELQARMSTSTLVAIDGESAAKAGGRTSGSLNGGPPDYAAAALGEAAAANAQTPDVTALMKAVGSAMGAGKAGQPSGSTRDSAWVKEVAEAKAPPVTYPSAVPSQNLLLQGTRIPAVTLEAVNSDMPGQITARATEDLRDSLTQKTVLVPAGTRFVGSYNAEVRPGQSRVLMAFSRMILPDGRSVELHASQATDAVGQSGITGEVNNHFLKMYAYSLAVAIAGEKVSNKGVTTSTSTGVGGQQQSTKTIAGEVLSDVSRRILERNSEIPPTITTPVGERIYITITRDIALGAWKGDYQ